MSEIVKEMGQEVPETFLRLQVFLPTMVAKPV